MTWLGKKDIVLNLYTCAPSVFNYSPIVEAKKEIPSWFKKLPMPYFNSPADHDLNMKVCTGVVDYYTNGFFLNLWSDLYLNIGRVGTTFYEWQYSDRESNLNTHRVDQWGHVLPETEYQHLKLQTPWIATCDTDIDFLVTQPDWRFDIDDKIHISSGILNFKYQCAMNVNLFIKRQKEDLEINLRYGTPLLHITPLTERKVILKTHLVDHPKFMAIGAKNRPISFFRHYDLKKKIMRTSGCPYQTDSK